MAKLLKIKRGEIRTIIITIHGIDISSATFLLEIRHTKTSPIWVTKTDGDFNKDNIGNGIIEMTINSEDTTRAVVGIYKAEFSMTMENGDIIKENNLLISVRD